MNRPRLSDAFHEGLLAAIAREDRRGALGHFDLLVKEHAEDGMWRLEAGFWAARGVLESAERLFEEPGASAGEDSVATLALALCVEARGDYPKAEQLCVDMLLRAPEDARPLEILADLYGRSGLASETEMCLLRLTALLPHPARAWVALGYLYLACGAREEAWSAFNKALSIDEGNVNALFGLGVVHQLRGDLELAKERFTTLIQQCPDEPHAMLALGFVHVLEKAPELAQGQFLGASEHGAPPAMVQLGLAQAALLRRQYDEAWSLAAPLVREVPDNVQILCAAWSAATGAGHSEEASELRGKLAQHVPAGFFSSLGL